LSGAFTIFSYGILSVYNSTFENISTFNSGYIILKSTIYIVLNKASVVKAIGENTLNFFNSIFKVEFKFFFFFSL